MKRFEVYLCMLGENYGSEQGGARPCIIVQNDIGNTYSPTTIVVPMTSKMSKKHLPTHLLITDGGIDKPSFALCEQIKVIDKKRVRKYLFTLSEKYQKNLERCMKESLGL